MALPRVAVVVLGELARSPRMVNHARELAGSGFDPVLIGYAGHSFQPPRLVRTRFLRSMARAGEGASKLVFLAVSSLRMGFLLMELTYALLRERPDTILVQNPPGFPTIIAAWIAARLCRARVMIDWHNYTYSMLAMRLGPQHWLVRLAERYEGWAGRRGSHHFSVSQAMSRDMAARWNIQAQVLYDRPLQIDVRGTFSQATWLTVACPAGWTADEDMALLLDAIELLPTSDFEFHLTGDGPLRLTLEPRIEALRHQGWHIHTGYLPDTDYWNLLRRADIGVSMHRSTSGLDLAMKVVDLFGAGVPVCAFDYGGALPEQVRDGTTGFLFRTALDLAKALQALKQFPERLDAIRDCLSAAGTSTWRSEWERIALPALRETD